MFSMKVKVVKETSKRITLYFPTLNRNMPVSREDFEKRIESGEYQLIG